MKKFILFVIFLFNILSIKAQDPTFEWAKSFGGATDDYGRSIAIDERGNIYTTGWFEGTVDFDPSISIFNLTSKGKADIYISKFTSEGILLWAKQFGDSLKDYGNSISVDRKGNVYSTGAFEGTVDFDPGSGICNLSSSGFNDIFISKLDSAGNFVWAKSFGGSSYYDIGKFITVDLRGNVYTTGGFGGIVDFDTNSGTILLESGIYNSIFVLKLDTSGNTTWAKKMGGILGNVAASLAVDVSGNVYSTGQLFGTADFDPGPMEYNLTSVEYNDIFISKLDSLGNFVWAKSLGGYVEEEGYAIAVDKYSNVYTTGYFSGNMDFDPGFGIFNLSSPGNIEAFILKLNSSGNFIWAKDIGGPSWDAGQSIKIDEQGNIYTSGYFTGTADFDPSPEIFNLISVGNYDIFISKLDTAGNFVWAKNMGGVLDDKSYSLALDKAGNIYSTGYYSNRCDFDPNSGINNLISAGGSDVFILKLSQTAPTGLMENSNSNNISIYPNPNNGSFNINISTPTKNGYLEIYNSLGTLVSKQKIINEQNTIKLTDQSNGLYFVKLMDENKIISIQKIVKQ